MLGIDKDNRISVSVADKETFPGDQQTEIIALR